MCAPCLTWFLWIPTQIVQLDSAGPPCLCNIDVVDDDCQYLWWPISTHGASSSGRPPRAIERYDSIYRAGKWCLDVYIRYWMFTRYFSHFTFFDFGGWLEMSSCPFFAKFSLWLHRFPRSYSQEGQFLWRTSRISEIIKCRWLSSLLSRAQSVTWSPPLESPGV